jgi:hypothetical protein
MRMKQIGAGLLTIIAAGSSIEVMAGSVARRPKPTVPAKNLIQG